MARFKGVDADPRVVGRELDVEVVVEGTVRRIGERMRLTARLLSVEDGFQLWAQRFERLDSEILVVSDETARSIADALLVHAAEKRVASSDPVAVDLYLRARAELRQPGMNKLSHAIELFRQAHEQSPGDVAILSGFARACSRRWFFEGGSGSDAISLAERAVSSAPRDPEAQLALATVRLVEGNVTASAAACRLALQLAPENPEAQELHGRLLLEVGRPEESIGVLLSAIRAESDVPNARFELVRAYALIGDIDSARRWFDSWPLANAMSPGGVVFRARIRTLGSGAGLPARALRRRTSGRLAHVPVGSRASRTSDRQGRGASRSD